MDRDVKERVKASNYTSALLQEGIKATLKLKDPNPLVQIETWIRIALNKHNMNTYNMVLKAQTPAEHIDN